MTMELRTNTELRAAKGDKGELYIEGYAAVFNTESKDLGGFREVVAPGAFTRSLKEGRDTKALFNHDANYVLGRRKNGTLELSQDERGLKFRCVLNAADPDAVALHARVDRMDIDECSFAFTVSKDGQVWAERQSDGGAPVITRTLTDVDLYDVSAVCYPAYPGTEVGTRGDVVAVEVRSMIAEFAAKRDLGAVVPPVVVPPTTEKRDDETDESLEEQICEVQGALSEAYPSPADNKEYYGSGKYWVLETHADYVIVCEQKQGEAEYFKISYAEVDDKFTFGEPQPVEKEWVPSERGNKRMETFRTAQAAALATRDAEDDEEPCDGCEETDCETCSAKRAAAAEAQRSADEVGDKLRRAFAAMHAEDAVVKP